MAILIIGLILFYPSFGVFFSQDDFFHFQLSLNASTWPELLGFFKFIPFEERGVAFYRPISREIFFNLYYSFFGLDSFWARIIQVIILIVNIFIASKIAFELTKNSKVSALTGLFIVTSSINVALLYYLAGGIQALVATLFSLTSILLFIKSFIYKSTSYYFLSFIFFLLAVCSHEISFITPILLALYLFVNSKRNLTSLLSILKVVFPYISICLVIFSLEVVIIGFSPNEEQYQVTYSLKKILNSFVWYFLWAWGLPEMLIDFVGPGLKLNPSLLKYWGSFYQIIFISFALSISTFTYIIFSLFRKRRSLVLNKILLVSFAWYIVSTLPVILLPSHKSTYYLALGIPGLAIFISIILVSYYSNLKHKLPVYIFIISFLALNITSIKLSESTYWAASRGKVAKQIISEVTSMYPTLPKGAIVYFYNDPNYPFVAKDWGGTSKQANFILNNDDALQLYYHDPTLKVYYEDLKDLPSGIPNDQIFKIMAKIN